MLEAADKRSNLQNNSRTTTTHDKNVVSSCHFDGSKASAKPRSELEKKMLDAEVLFGRKQLPLVKSSADEVNKKLKNTLNQDTNMSRPRSREHGADQLAKGLGNCSKNPRVSVCS